MSGKIEKYERLGMDTPKGMVIDTEGKERTDTKQVICSHAHTFFFAILVQFIIEHGCSVLIFIYF